MTIYNSGYTNAQKIAFFDAIEKGLQAHIGMIEERLKTDMCVSYLPDDELEKEVAEQVLKFISNAFSVPSYEPDYEHADKAYEAFDYLVREIADLPQQYDNVLKSE